MRTDIHSPANIIPSNYTIVGFQVFTRDDDCADYLAEMLDDIEHRLGDVSVGYLDEVPSPAFDGNHRNRGTCDHCGAAFLHRAIFRHDPTGEHIVVGLTCASNTFTSTNFGVIQQRIAKVKKAAKTKVENDARAEEWLQQHPDFSWVKGDSRFDWAYQSVRKWGRLTEKQTAFIAKVTKERALEAEMAGRIQAECGLDIPEPFGGIDLSQKRPRIQGVIVGLKTVDGYYGNEYKMMVLACDKKVWVTEPANIYAKRGMGVEFDANLTWKDDDFAIGKRPTKAKVLFEPAQA